MKDDVKNGIEWNEISAGSQGGTEQMARRVEKAMPSDLMDEFQIVLSRVRELKEDKIRLLYCHDLPEDPESHHLKDEGWKKFHHIVFVSYWQRQAYMKEYNIPHSRCSVLHNAVERFEEIPLKPIDDKIRFIYSTTPHRGLELLIPVFERLLEKHKNIHLDVYSSFGIYGWKKRDEQYKPLFDHINDNPDMTYHGYKPVAEVRKALETAHIFAYPSIWQETSCLSLIEAMASKCICVHSDLAALPETASNWTAMYDYNEDHNIHASNFYRSLETVISLVEEKYEALDLKLSGQKSYCDLFYNWDVRKLQWENLLKSLVTLPRDMEDPAGPCFEYKVA